MVSQRLNITSSWSKWKDILYFCRVLYLVLINIFVLVIIYIKDLKGRREIILTKSVHDITPEHTTAMIESSIRIQHHPDKQGNRLKKVIQWSREGYTNRDKKNKLHDPGSGMIAQTAVLQKRYAVYNGLQGKHESTLSLIAKRQISVLEQAHKGTAWQTPNLFVVKHMLMLLWTVLLTSMNPYEKNISF